MLFDPMIYYGNCDASNEVHMADKNEENMGVDFSFFTSDKAKNLKDFNSDVPAEPKKKRTKTDKVSMDDRIDGKGGNESSFYYDSYSETNSLLKETIAQTDQLNFEIKSDIDGVRASKTLKNKYTYITNLTSTSASLLATKISAIKELNGTITQAHNLDLKKQSVMKEDASMNDDARMMDLYSAFINAPVGTYAAPNTTSIQDAYIVTGSNHGIDIAGAMPTQNLTPEQIAMRMESNPNITTVVKYDNSTGQRFFDVIDSTTGQSVPNVPRPDNFLLEETSIDVRAGIARNRNLDKVWPLVTIGDDKGIISEY